MTTASNVTQPVIARFAFFFSFPCGRPAALLAVVADKVPGDDPTSLSAYGVIRGRQRWAMVSYLCAGRVR